MRVKIRNQTVSKENTVELDFVQQGDCVRVIVYSQGANNDYDYWYLLKICPSGIYREPAIPKSLGFELDDIGRLPIVSE